MAKNHRDPSFEFGRVIRIIDIFTAFRRYTFQRFRAVESELSSLKLEVDRNFTQLSLSLKAQESVVKKKDSRKLKSSKMNDSSIDFGDFR